MNLLKILVTGASGQLGSELSSIASLNLDFEFIFVSRKELPIDDPGAVYAFFEAKQPQYCINCAAYTAVDKAESNHEEAFLINGDATGTLASACHLYHTKFIHISTDYVFNGRGTQPYTEDEDVDPVNTYGASKLRGEKLAIKQNPQSVVIRTSWVYSRYGNNFVKTMMRLMKEKSSLSVINDQKGSPTYAADLAKALIEIIRGVNWIPGIYNYCNQGIISWFDFAMAIKGLTNSSCEIVPIPASEFLTAAKRPGYSVLDTKKIRSVYNISISGWEEGLAKCIQLLTH